MEPKATTPGKWVEVIYYNHTILVPAWTKYLAMDDDGAVFAYEAPPVAYEGKWCHLACYKAQLVAEFVRPEDWTSTLREIT